MAFSTIACPAHFRVVGYYPAWQRATLPASSVRVDYLTHLNQAFAWPLADGSITGYPDLSYPELVSTAHIAGRKILISCGGWGNSDGFAPMAADSTSRARFVANLVDYLTVYGLDGVDIDWEPLSNATERANLVKLVRDIRTAFDEVDSTWLLTMAVPPSDWSGRWFDFTAMTPFVDWYNVMTYDTHGSWTAHAGHNCPLYAPAFDTDGSVDQAVTYLRGRGIPGEKIVVGIPFYGKDFAADSLYQPSTGCTDIAYAAIPARLAAGWTYHWDNLSKVPYLTLPSLHRTLCYDDSLSVTLKCAYARERSLGGVMIWALGQDVIAGTQPLTEAVGKATLDLTCIPAAQDARMPERNRLLQNYPNPFNQSSIIRYELSGATHVHVTLHNALGQAAAVLVDEGQEPGVHTVQLDAGTLASGAYFCRLAAGGSVSTLRLVIVK